VKDKGYKPRLSLPRLQEWVTEQVAAATERGLANGMGVDVAASMSVLSRENEQARAIVEMLVRYLEPDTSEAGQAVAATAAVFLSLPRAQLALRSEVPATSAEANSSADAVEVGGSAAANN